MAQPLEDDFVLTISDNDDRASAEEELFLQSNSDGGRKRKSNDEAGKKQKKKKKQKASTEDDIEVQRPSRRGGETLEDDAMNSDFEFQIGDVVTGVLEDFDGWGVNSTTEIAEGKNKKGVDIDELIARRRAKGSEVGNQESQHQAADEDEAAQAEERDDESVSENGFGMGVDIGDESDGDGMDDQDDDSADDSVASPAPHPDDERSDLDSDGENLDPAEKAKQDAFFAPQEPQVSKTGGSISSSFQSMSLSRPILRGLTTMGFSEPTPIQAKTIPVALLGKDVVGGAVTGSGKTGAFMIPILERLLYRPKKIPTSRVAILMPTRELAVQCVNVARKLASFTDITFCQLVGGFSLRDQENVLRSRPDVIIATPGRFIDHMRNSASFTVDTLEILVLDEADRMLEDGFADELNEILTTIPKSRQTMLFSATMTDTVDKLIRVGLNRPVRLIVDARKQTVSTLVQEFVRLRPGREDKRLAYLMYLCSTVFTDRSIIFFRQKKEAHRVRIIFGLCGFKASELHGSMSQEQRISSIESFRSGAATHLLATDVASRGLDIKGVETVINYEAPQSHEIYLHRVGRTARAGRSGRSCTIAAEPDRRVVKAAVRMGKAQGAKIVSRVVESEAADEWDRKLKQLDVEVEAVMKEEKEERSFGIAEMQVKKGENVLDFADEIRSRPQRTWFESEKEKAMAKEKGRRELNGEAVGKTKKVKLSNKDKKKMDDGRERREGKVWKKGRKEREEKVSVGGGIKKKKISSANDSKKGAPRRGGAR